MNKITKFRFFTIPEYEKEQDWLRKEHNEGWEFYGVTFPGFYHFRKCEPKDVIYQLDYNPEGNQNKSSYIQIFQDCDWEYIADFMGYTYFRKPVEEMYYGEEEIFSDDASKLEMSRRVFKGRMLPMLIIFFSIIIPQLTMQLAHFIRPIFYIYSTLFILYVVIFAWYGIQYWTLHRKVFGFKKI